jgi:nucleotide-binding universal stress UspA family protein
MTYREILVHVKAYEQWSPHIDVALQVARSCGARLTGLYTSREIAMLRLVLGAQSSAVKEAAARERPLAAEIERKFRAAAAKAGVEIDWQTGEGLASELLVLAGRYFDLVIVEQTIFAVDEIGRDTAEECAVQCGRPVLILPRDRAISSVGKRIVIGWNASRQAAAAVHGALGFVAGAESVTVLVGRDKDAFPSVTRWPKLDIGAYLERHGARVRMVPFEGNEAHAGAKLIEAAREADADLLVMGAYGRSAWREFIFGGATRDVLASMQLPVLMAH